MSANIDPLFRSIYDFTMDLLSATSGVPFVLMKGGIPGEGYRVQWDSIAAGLDSITDLPVLFFEYSRKLLSFDQLLEQMRRSVIDDNFNRLILSGIANLCGFHEDDGFGVNRASAIWKVFLTSTRIAK